MNDHFTAIGQLNERVTLQEESRTADDSGGYMLVWVDIATLWAAVTPLSPANEAQGGEQLTGRSRYRVTLRRRTDVTTAHRLVWRNAALNIRAITQNIGASLTDLIAEEGPAT